MGLYHAYRTLGLVCDGAALATPALFRRGGAAFVVTPVDSGRSLQLYDVEKLHLRGASPVLAPKGLHITATAAADDRIFAAVGSTIHVLQAMRVVDTWDLHVARIDAMMPLGDYVVSISTTARRMVIHDRDGAPASDISFQDDFEVSVLAHPATYLNKVLVGATDGRMQLWNIRTNTMVYQFPGFGSAVTVIEPSPVVDVVAIGLQDGRIILHNLRQDEVILEFHHQSKLEAATAKNGVVTALAFRTDGDEVLISASEGGTLAVWDLNNRRIRCMAHAVHEGGAALACFLPNEPVLVTCGRYDNSLKVHLFDAPNGAARVLRQRAGHSSAPTKLEFCGKDPRQMVSAGSDREVRLISLIRDAQNRALSQRGKKGAGNSSARKKRRLAQGIEIGAEELPSEFNRLPAVVALASGDTRRRDKDFANVVTGHQGLGEAHLWRLDDSSIKGGLLVPRLVDKPAPVSAALVSHCGNYAVIGSQAGRLDLYNLQSARHVGAFQDGLSANTHEGQVTGLASDGCGDMVVSAGEQDRMLKFWELRSRTLLFSIKTNAGPLGLRWCRNSDLVAVRSDDFNLYIYDAETKRLARCFEGHVGPITDMSFSGDGRWLVTASMDSTIRTWDLPSGKCIDILSCSTAPVSVAVSPDSAFIASAHTGNLGVALWVNKAHFDIESLGSVQAGSRRDMGSARLPGAYDGWEDANLEERPTNNDGMCETIENTPVNQTPATALAPHLITLSGHPASHWTPLSNLEAIKARNKPTEAVKKPDDIPFFLPTTKEIHPQFETSKTLGSEQNGDRKQVDFESAGLGLFGGLLVQDRFEDAGKYIEELSPSGADFELRCLDSQLGRKKAAEYFVRMLSERSRFELTQAHLGVFLRVHGVEFARDPDSRGLLLELKDLHSAGWSSLRAMFSTVLTLTSFLSGQHT